MILIIPKNTQGQMSEAMVTVFFLTLSGGLQDAYTYYYRGGVYANAQTGNIIMLTHNLMNQNWRNALRYFLPVLAFGAGIFISEKIREIYKEHQWIHWRQIVVMIEIILLFLVGFMPVSFQIEANSLVSFVCAMQVEAFRKVKGSAFASTMCIGNLRSATEMLYRFFHTKDVSFLEKSMRYYGVITIFAMGAAVGSFLTPYLKEKTIWVSCTLLMVVFCIMFIQACEEKVCEDQK